MKVKLILLFIFLFILKSEAFSQTTYKVTFSNEVILPFTDIDFFNLSPDGSKLVFIKNDLIWSCNSNGTGIIQMPNISQGKYLSPKWSPDGSKILYLADGGFSLNIINSDGSQQQMVFKSYTGELMYPYWWPDGTKILFYLVAGAYTDATGNLKYQTGMFQFDLSTQKYKPFGAPYLSKICFFTDCNKEATLYGKNLIFLSDDGTEIERITLKTPLQGRGGPVCANNGKYIIVDNFLITTSTKQEISFLPDNATRYKEQGKPDLTGPNFISLSRDSKKISFAMCPSQDCSFSRIKIMDLTWQ